MKYEVRNVKGFTGEDCPGFNASLYCDGQKVAFVIDSGNGGELTFQWTDRNEPKVDIKWVNHKDEEIVFKGTPEEAKIHNLLFGQKMEFEGKLRGQKSLELFVAELVNEVENNRRFKRLCKTKTLFQVKGDEKGSYRVIKQIYSKRIRDFIERTYGDQVEVILNEKFGGLPTTMGVFPEV